MEPSKHYEAAGGIASNGDYYGSSDPEITYLHLGLSTQLMKEGIIPESSNPDKGLEENGWIKQHGDSVITLDSFNNEKPLTMAQIKTLCNIMSGEYVFINFVNQDKYIAINKLLDMNKWQLHYEITT